MKLKKILASLMALFLVINYIPNYVFAEENDPSTDNTTTEVADSNDAEEETIDDDSSQIPSDDEAVTYSSTSTQSTKWTGDPIVLYNTNTLKQSDLLNKLGLSDGTYRLLDSNNNALDSQLDMSDWKNMFYYYNIENGGVFTLQKRTNKGSWYKPNWQYEDVYTGISIQIHTKIKISSVDKNTNLLENGGIVLDNTQYTNNAEVDVELAEMNFGAIAVDGYHVSTVTVDGKSLSANSEGKYTYTPSISTTSLQVVYEENGKTDLTLQGNAVLKNTDESVFDVTNVVKDKAYQVKLQINDNYELVSENPITTSGCTLNSNGDGTYTLVITDDHPSISVQTVFKYVHLQLQYDNNTVKDVQLLDEEGNVVASDSDGFIVEPGETYTLKASSKDSSLYIAKINDSTTYDVDRVASTKITVNAKKGDSISQEIKTAAVVVVKESCEANYNNLMSGDEAENAIIDAMVDWDSSAPWLKDDRDSLKAYITRSFLWHTEDHRIKDYTKELKTSEKVKLKYKTKTVGSSTVTLIDLRKEPTIDVQDGVSVRYCADNADFQEDLLEALEPSAIFSDSIISSDLADFTVQCKKEVGQQTATITYKGNKEYKNVSKEVVVNVVKGIAKVTVHSQNIKVGEKFDTIFSADPKEASVIGIIAGVGYEKNDDKQLSPVPFVSLDISETNYSIITQIIGSELNVDRLQKLHDLLNSSKELFDDGILGANFVENFNTVYDLIMQIPGIDKISLKLNQTPTLAGVYTAAGVSTNKNYKTSVGVGYLTITRKNSDIQLITSDVDEMYDGTSHGLSAKVVDENGVEVVGAEPEIRYLGVDIAGNAYDSTEAPVDAGVYTGLVTYGGSDAQRPTAAIDGSVVIRRSRTKVTVSVDSTETTYGELSAHEHSVQVSANEELTDAEKDRIVEDAKNNIICPVEGSSEVGSYGVSTSISRNVSKNYSHKIKVENGEHVVVAKKLSFIPAQDMTVTYGDSWDANDYSVKDGDSDVSADVIAQLGLHVYYTDVDGNVLQDKPTDVGQYKAVYAYDNANYELTGTLETNIEIVPKEIYVRPSANEIGPITYGDAYTMPSINIFDKDGQDITDSLHIDIQSNETYYQGQDVLDAKPVDVGTYSVDVQYATTSKNYQIVNEPHRISFEILPRSLEGSADGVIYVTYGDPISLNGIDILDRDIKGNKYSRKEELLGNQSIVVDDPYYTDMEGNLIDGVPSNVGKYFAVYSYHVNNENYLVNTTSEGNIRTCVTIVPKVVNEQALQVRGLDNVVYNGKEQKPVVEIYDGNTQLIENVDYTLAYISDSQVEEDFLNAKKIGVEISFLGNYTSEGTIVLSYTIAPKDITSSSVKIQKIENVVYDGSAHKCVPVVQDTETGSTLVENVDYTVSYSGDFVLGDVTVTVQGIGNYTGTKALKYSIQKQEMKKDDSQKQDDSQKSDTKKQEVVDTSDQSHVTMFAGTCVLAVVAFVILFVTRKKMHD